MKQLASRIRRAGTFAKLLLTLLVLAPLSFAAQTLWLHHVYWSQHAKLTRNYAAELNAEAALVPEDQRAWPHYRDLLNKLDCRLPPEFFTKEEYLRSRDPQRLRAIACLEKNQSLLPRLREVAAMPKLGYIMRDASDPADLSWRRRLNMGSGQSRAASENPQLLLLLMDYNPALRRFAQLLRLDAEMAADRGDDRTVADDLIACLNIASQFKSQPMALDDMASWSVLISTTWLVDWLLTENAALVSDDRLRLVSERLIAYVEQEGLQPRLHSESMMFHDTVQRLYSDDGKGDGIFLAHLLEQITVDPGRDPDTKSRLLAPFGSSRCATRREVVDRYEEMFTAAARAFAVPLWDCHELPGDISYDMDVAEQPRYVLIPMLLPGMSGIYLASKRAEQECDAAIAAVTLARFYLAAGRWPERLEELVPAYLSSIPLDCFTGTPLLYRLAGGQPLLYSVGANRDDDGGTPPASGDENDVAKWQTAGEPAPNGDWVFWPRRQPPLDKSGFYGTP